MSRLRLKKIDLVGFKSFADRTTLQFEAGVTAIVGPNGCGKSNVADAFRWVMGEQSARSLRGEKMADVLFAGTTKRKKAPYCEVTLTFDNSDGYLPIPFQEVAVTRTLTCKGDSGYRINGNSVRLKDVHHLFFDTGLGKEAFAIFEQGKVEEIILRTPEERRPIFEQAAGIARYRHQWKEAKRKLEQTEQHLTRLSDIASEVDKQIRLLEKQVEEANAYKENKRYLEELETAYLATKWARHEASYHTAKTSLTSIGEKQRQSTSSSHELKGAKEDAKGKLATKEGELKRALEALYALRASLQVHQVESEGLGQRLSETKERITQCQRELERVEGEQKQIQEEANALQQTREAVGEKVHAAESALQESQGALTECQKTLHTCQEQQVQLQKSQMDQVQKAHALTSRLKEGEVRLEASQERKERVEEGQSELEKTLQEQKTLIEERQRHSEKLLEEAVNLRRELDKLNTNLATLEEKERQGREAEALLVSAMAEKRARQKVLLQLEEAKEGLSKAAQTLLQQAQADASPFRGELVPLMELVTPLPGHEGKIASVLQLYSGTLFAKSDKALSSAWEWSQQEGLTNFSITSKSLLAKAARPKTPNLTAFVEPESPLMPLLESCSTEEGGGSYLAKGGEYLDHAGILFSTPSQDTSPVMRKSELKTLKGAIEKGEKEHARLIEECTALREERGALVAKHSSLDIHLRQTEIKLVECNVSLERARADFEQATESKAKALREHEELTLLQDKLKHETHALKQEAEKARKTLTLCQEKADQVATTLQQQLDKVREFAKTRRRREETLHELSLERHGVASRTHLIEAKTLSLQKEKHRLATESEELTKKEKELASALESVDKPAENTEELKASEKACEALEAHVTKMRAQLEVLEKEEEEEARHTQELDKRAHELEIEMAKEKAASDALQEEMQERFELDIATQNSSLEMPLDEAEKTLRALRKKVEGASEVNLAAASEYDEKKERAHFLSEQLDDLYTSKGELEEIIEALDQESRVRFAETFEKVRAHFKEQFQILFDGGEADLTFTGSDDILLAGIDIIAKPPGKKMRSIKLLSGGEKALCAMALLFALFEEKPAPFCILDEMDAPLDDSNVERFINVVKPFMDRTQFLIITHNKRSMAAADILFGVSMEEKGISKVVQLEFEKKPEALAIA